MLCQRQFVLENIEDTGDGLHKKFQTLDIRCSGQHTARNHEVRNRAGGLFMAVNSSTINLCESLGRQQIKPEFSKEKRQN